MNFEWPDGLAEEIWGELPSSLVKESHVAEILELVKPQVAGYVAELEKTVAREKMVNGFLRLNNKNVFTATQDYLVKLQVALAELAPDHELLQGRGRELPEPVL
jgi:hypothetical protein